MSEEIISEIGELLGRFKDDIGRKEFFQNKLHSGSGNNHDHVNDFDAFLERFNKNNSNWKQPKPQPDPFLNGILMDFGETRKFYGWQKNVLTQLGNPKSDVYVVAPPGGGKTTPLMAHYVVDIFLQGNNGEISSTGIKDVIDGNNVTQQDVQKWANIFHGLLCGKYLNGDPVPRCLFVTPIRVLSFEQAEGFQDYFLDLLLLFHRFVSNIKNEQPDFNQLKNSNNPQEKIIGLVFGSLGMGLYRRIYDADNFAKFAKERTENMICVKTGGGNGNFNDNPKNSTVIIATYGSAKNFIGQVGNSVRFVVFDEAHLYQPSEDLNASVRSQENEVRGAADAYTIVDTLTKNKKSQIAFLSGTIHPVSAENFSQFLNRHYGRNMTVVTTPKGDTEAGNKTMLSVNADDGIRTVDEQVRRIINWIQTGQTGNAIILFSKKKINELVDKVMTKLTQRDVRDKDFGASTSNREREDKIARYRRALAISNPDATADKIKEQVDAFIEKEFPSSQRQLIEKIKNKPGATQIVNKKLRNAVGYGLGFIYRQDDVEPNDSNTDVEPVGEKDKMIVADLFSQGKINVLLATAAIGVGVNVSIKNMYLPSCWKFERGRDNSGRVDLNNKREMSQLINRTGRGKVPISGLYTPKEFVPYLQDIVNMSIEDFDVVPAISISTSQDLKDVLLDLSGGVPTKIRQSIGAAATKSSKYISSKLQKISSICKKWASDIHPNQQQKLDRQTTELERQIDLMDRVNTNGDKISQLTRKLEINERIIQTIKDKLLNMNTNQADAEYARCHRMIEKLKTKRALQVFDLSNEIMSKIDSLENDITRKDKSINESKYRQLDELRKLKTRYHLVLGDNSVATRRENLQSLYDRKLQLIKNIKECENKKQELRQKNITDVSQYRTLDAFMTSFRNQIIDIDKKIREQQTY